MAKNIQEVADRCIEWMQDVINFHLNITGGNLCGEHLDAVEDAEFIIESIKLRMGEE